MDQSLTSAFMAAQPSAASGAPPPDLEARLGQLVAQGRAAWPALDLPAAAFVAFVGARAALGAAALDALPVADLYLACACVHRVAGALEAFDRQLLPLVTAAVRAIDASPQLLDEVRQALHDRLFVGSAGGAPRIGHYLGQGPLSSWVGVAAQRIALGLLRGETALARAHQRAWAAEPNLERDPELAMLKQRYKGAFEAALRDASRALSDRERSILSLHLLSGLTQDRLAGIYGVHPATVHRWMERARATLFAETERLLQERLQVSSKEFASLARLVGSQLDVGVASLLREEPR